MAEDKPNPPAPIVPPSVQIAPVAQTPEELKKSQVEADKLAEQEKKAQEAKAKDAEKKASLNKRAQEWKTLLEQNNTSQNPDFVAVYNELLGEKETFNGYNIGDDERRRAKFLAHFQPKQTKKQ